MKTILSLSAITAIAALFGLLPLALAESNEKASAALPAATGKNPSPKSVAAKKNTVANAPSTPKLVIDAMGHAGELSTGSASVDALAMTFVAARLAYLGCYLADLHWLRSIAWFVGIGSAVAIFVAAS